MKSFTQFLAEDKETDKANKHKVRLIHHPDFSHLLDGDILHVAKVKSTAKGKSLITGQQDMDFDYKDEAEARTAVKRFKRAFGKRIHVKYYSYPKDME